MSRYPLHENLKAHVGLWSACLIFAPLIGFIGGITLAMISLGEIWNGLARMRKTRSDSPKFGELSIQEA